MKFNAWINDLDELDILTVDLGAGDLLTIYRYQVEWYQQKNPGCTFRPVQEEQHQQFEASNNVFAEGIQRDETRWARM